MSHNLSRFESSGSACAILANSDSIIAANADILPVVNKALDSVVTRNQKKELSIELLAVYSSQEPYSRLSNNVDKLSALVESADRSPAERHGMVTVLSSLLMDYNSDVATQLPKVLTKLVGVACRLVVKEDSSSSQYGLHILRILVEYKARPIMLPHAKQVRQTCLQLMSARSGGWSGDYADLTAEVYALYASMEPTENWTTIWVEAVQECTTLVGLLGIGTSSNGLAGAGKKGIKKGGQGPEGAAVSPLVLFADSDALQLRGVAKALRVQQLFQCAAAVLAQLLRVGCSSGFVALNVTNFLPLLQLVLSANADVNVKDPVSYIEGEAGVAPVDVALVLSLLKVDLLNVVTTLLNIDHPALVRIGTSLVRPVAALLTRPEGKGAVPRLQRALLRCLAAAARALPSVTAASVNSTPIGLLELLQSEIQDLTANQALLSQTQAASDAKKENAKEAVNTDGNLTFSTGVSSTVPVNLTGVVISSISGTMDSTTTRFEFEADRAERLTVLFETWESVLLYCGPLLSASVRESFTTAVYQSLSCLAQGVLVPQFADRHMHRYAGARLRQDLTAQRLLLSLATVEVFSPPQLQHQAQQFSRNLPLLKRCAELCLRNTVTAGVAARVLLQVSTLLHPVTVALPAVPAIDTARSYILTASEALPLSAPSSAVAPAAFDSVDREDAGQKRVFDVAHGEPVVSTNDAEDAAGSPAKRPKASDFAAGRSMSESKAKVTPQAAAGAGRRASLDSAPKATTAAPSVLNTTASKANTTAVVNQAAAEEDDESLPDIDIDADPDSD